ncbi:mRNA capping methyltransferase [Leishmania donovani]|uniref:mRNA (guanine-N(7))-methyltransferase n=3 Tax=Leishmania donovani species complex TaxID=38574 RepID=A4ICX5_LEIIN|nr:putative mRNA capping methyltransferase [Leishmania infantum JPCM5]XP_003865131.1 mRNA capping methyltransferase, putative [Leishmania donovani]CAC9548472.1 mRNA_capping_methyltransferase_-_putative [Leishmania infantum]AYU83354.1 mRNA capping methyltransferase, putative [Leishmania donovani]TPP42428.1 mRNA capping enzyme family protein [Leishmania donovani]TPP48129.1 mRNA capping enzyme family protein [Leishmania donovani]CAJ1993369.1 mRNA capping methyltransferase [Leishmania donovani]|eukprot:XP_001469594.1 putative mRNA capping methyltransferase [Leishmania infantum JPCM5]
MSQNRAAAAYDDVTRKRKDDWSSQQVAFRHFNNFVKKALIQFSLDCVLANAAASPSEGAVVLDLASGRGGDIGKWFFMQSPSQSNPRALSAALHTSVYDCYDVSLECINEAERRCKEMIAAMERPPQCCASFTVADCFTESFLRGTLPCSPHFGRYSVVSIQFAFHYACKSLDLIRDVFSAVSDALAPGGVVLITTVDIEMLSKRAAEGTLGNELYSISFPNPPEYAAACNGNALLVTGTEYHFRLDGFVDCPEYVVPHDAVVQIASEARLRLCEGMSKPFSEFVPDYSANWKANKGNKLSPAELELVTLYRALCFVKEKVAL